MSASNRIEARFDKLARENRAAFVTFVTAGDPDPDTSLDIVRGLIDAGADVIELGMPFTDPMADGPAIQESSLRALKRGMTLRRTLDMVREIRRTDDETPLVLMGYFNPIHAYGVDVFVNDAKAAGVDGLIVVDLPPEEDAELCLPALKAGINFIRLATPTTDDKRLPAVLANTSGFVYYVSVAGVTGTKRASAEVLAPAVARLKRHTNLPVCVGFGITTPQDAAAVARIADGVVVGTALVRTIADHLAADGRATESPVRHVTEQARAIAQGIRAARQMASQA